MPLDKIGFLREKKEGEKNYGEFSATRRCLHAIGEKNHAGVYKCNLPGYQYCSGYWWFCCGYEPNLNGQIEMYLPD